MAPNALEAWKARSRAEVTLPSGAKVTVHLTTPSDLILAGKFEGPVVALARKIEAGTLDETAEASDEDIAAARTFRRTIVASMIDAIEGEAVSLTAADLDGLPEPDVDDLWLYHLRLKPLYGESAPF